MLKYTQILHHGVVYSLGDVHGQGGRMVEFVKRLKRFSAEKDPCQAAFVQLGDLCDGFSFPEDDSRERLIAETKARIARIPELHTANGTHVRLVNWRLDAPERDYFKGSVRGTTTIEEICNEGARDMVVALYQAIKCFETLKFFFEFQTAEPHQFYVVLGNHDADLLRGCCRYGKQQKYILLNLLGFTADEVIKHMTVGTPNVMLRSPYLAWLNARPHLLLSGDTAYMHGGPTGKLSRKLRCSPRAFRRWLTAVDVARTSQAGWNHSVFCEHESFLSPDKADDDWISHPEFISAFCRASHKAFLAVGHSPFLDYAKGKRIDLGRVSQAARVLFRTPARLAYEGKLIKHDTNLKRIGEMWACRHQVGSKKWTGIDEKLTEEVLLRGPDSSAKINLYDEI